MTVMVAMSIFLRPTLSPKCPNKAAAKRARKETNRVGSKGCESASNRVEGGKEEAVENERGGGTINKEVIPFDNSSN